ncbi:hypothetical protein [Microbacterium sp. zg-YB36]|uniref:hypothetical protein n=1 Tax=Microbacterium sp. zg-YB36 TaxID=2969407 RepID=UPI00214C81B0|nr:hypothetical protein [Microbacterium sp. zg-YB36]MDL5351138.1 hypothetical protein [Microbacterium sp. zg-YB36]
MGAPEPRDELRTAIGAVLVNAFNFPERVQARLLGQDMAPLIDKVTAAVRAAGFEKAPEPEWEYTVRHNGPLGLSTPYYFLTPEEAVEYAAQHPDTRAAVRRRMFRAGPWLPIGGE